MRLIKPSDLTVFIPTRGNPKFIFDMCKRLETVHEVIFLATDVDINVGDLPDNALILMGGKRHEKRHKAVTIARNLGLPYCIQIDDDLKAKDMSLTCCKLAEMIIQFPMLGTVCAQSRTSLGLNWLPDPVSHPFVIKNFSACFFAVNVAAYSEVPGFRVSVFDDLDLSAQMWNAGFANAAILAEYDYARRTGNSDPKMGGMPNGEYERGVEAGLEALRSIPNVLSDVAGMYRNGHTRHKVKWNLDWMFSNFTQRWPDFKYQDSKIKVGY